MALETNNEKGVYQSLYYDLINYKNGRNHNLNVSKMGFIHDLTNDFEKRYKSVYHRFMKQLIQEGHAKSFRELKKIDRIEMGDCLYETKRIFDSMHNKTTSFYSVIPFINEGVLVYYVGKDIMIYHYFMIKNIDLEKSTLEIYHDIYEYDGEFYVKIVELETTNSMNEKCEVIIDTHNCAFDIHYYNMYEKFNAVKEHFSKDDLEVFNLRKQVFGNMNNKALIGEILEKFMRSIEGINRLLEDSKTEQKSKDTTTVVKSKSNLSKTHSNVDPSPSTKRKSIKNDVVIINGIKIKKGENSQIKIRQGVVINRQTQVWGVIGHFRHYKNGKVVYIQPYKKGPGRDKEGEKPNRKIYKVKTNEEVQTNDRN